MVTGPRLLVWGAGGHGKVVADLVGASGGFVVGFVDADERKIGSEILGIPVVADERTLLRLLDSNEDLPGGAEGIALGIGDNGARVGRLASARHDLFPALLHPSAVVSPSATLGHGSVVLANSVVNAGARIGRAAIVNTGAIIEHDCVLEDGVHVSPGAVLAGGVRVGPRAWIGAGATVIQALRIGADAMVGAGAAVIRDVANGRTVVGVPARELGTLE